MIKRISAVFCSLAIMMGLVSNSAVYADTFELVSVKVKTNSVILEFNNGVDEQEFSNNIIVLDDGNSIDNVGIALDEENNKKIILSLPESQFGEECQVVIKNGLLDENSLNLSSSYSCNVRTTGFTEDFGDDYSTGDWTGTTISSSNTALTSKDVIIDNGKMIIPENVFAYKRDYTSHQYLNSDLEFDFELIIPCSSDEYTLFAIVTKLTGDNDWFNVSEWSLRVLKGYTTAFNYTNGTVLYSKMDSTKNTIGWNLDYVGCAPLDNVNWSSILGNKYRMKIETRTVNNTVTTNFYYAKYGIDGAVPTFSATPIFTKVDETNAYIDAGTFAFYVQKGTFEIDNIKYVGLDEKDFTSAIVSSADIEQQIKDKIDELEALPEGTDISDGLAEVKNKIELFEELTGTQFDSEYKEKFDLLAQFKFMGVNTFANEITLKFSSEVDSSTIAGNIVVRDENNLLISPSVTCDGLSVKILLNAEIVGKSCSVLVKKEIENADGQQLPDSYLFEYDLKGFYEDFGEGYSNGDWTEIKTDGSGTIVVTSDMSAPNGRLELYRYVAIKKDYTNYKSKNFILEYDTGIITSASEGDWANGFTTLLKLNGEGSTGLFTANQGSLISNSGYGLLLAGAAGDAYFHKYDSTQSSFDTTGSLNASAGMQLGNMYRMKICVTTDEENDKVNVKLYKADYTDDVLGNYSLVCEKTDDVQPYTYSGTFAFYARQGTHAIDNVAYIDATPQQIQVNRLDDVKDTLTTELETLTAAMNSLTSQSVFTQENKNTVLRVQAIIADYSDIISSDKINAANDKIKSLLFVGEPTMTYSEDSLGNESVTVNVNGIIPSHTEGQQIKIKRTFNSQDEEKTVVTGANGAFNASFVINDTGVADYIDFIINGNGFTKTLDNTLYYAPKSARISDIADILDETTKELMAEKIACHDTALAIENELYNSVTPLSIANVMFGKYDETTLTYQNVREEFLKNTVVAAFNSSNGNDAILSLLFNSASNSMNYSDQIGITNTEFMTMFKNDIADDKKIEVAKRLCSKNLSDSVALKQAFNEQTALCAIAYPKLNGTGSVENVLNLYTQLGLDLTKYNNSEKSSVNGELINKNYESIALLQNDIDALSDKYPKKTVITPSGNGGGIGGGGSVITGTVGFGDVVLNNKPVNNDVFNDISNVSWAKDAIEALYKKGIINGVGENNFNPNGYVTREQIAKMIYLAFECEYKETDAKFEDVAEGQWYTDYIKTLAAKGIINGVSENSFGLGMNVTRQDISTMIARTMGLNSSDQAVVFTDKNQIADYAADAVKALVEKGILNGFEDGSFRPREYCTRAQAAVIIYNAMNAE